MGLKRTVSVLNNQKTAYKTDIFSNHLEMLNDLVPIMMICHKNLNELLLNMEDPHHFLLQMVYYLKTLEEDMF